MSQSGRGEDMTEAEIVAASGIGGTILGVVIGSLSAFLNTRSQLKARGLDLQEQFAHEDKEKVIARRIERRSSYLSPIGQEILSIAKAAHSIEKNMSELVKWSGGDNIVWSYSPASAHLEAVREPEQRISQSLDTIEILRPQNTDDRFFGFMRQTIALSDQVLIDVAEIRSMRDRHGEGDFSYKVGRVSALLNVETVSLTGRPTNLEENPNKQIQYQCMRILEMVTALFESIRLCNKRIEDLLSGTEEKM